MMKEFDCHVDAEALETYSMGTSSLENAGFIEEHLLVCPACQERLRETDNYLNAVRNALQQRQGNERTTKARERRWAVWFPALAAAACLLMVGITLRLVRSPAPVVAVSLNALRSNSPGSSAPAGRELVLHPDLTGLVETPSYRLEIVDRTGRPVREGTLWRTQTGFQVRGIGAGLYYVRLYLPAGELLREYGLEIH